MKHGRGSDYDFSRVPSASIPRSVFSRSHGYKTTFDAGFLIPFYVDEALPGDTFRVNVHFMARIATLLFPLMDNMYMDFFFFAIPRRLTWSNWQRFMGEQDNPADSISFIEPVVTDPVCSPGTLGDYMGLPFASAGVDVVAHPFRAYNLVWNQWFRDENLQNSVTVPLTDGPDAAGTYTLLRRGKRHDYFTSALPWPQKGATGVTLPLGTTAPVVRVSGASVPGVEITDTGATIRQATLQMAAGADSGSPNPVDVAWPGGVNAAGGSPLRWGTTVGLMTDLSAATAATINTIRQAFQIQKLLERDARGGTRYTEIVRSHFGVVSPDARLNRPEYLGGGSVPLNTTQVAVTNRGIVGSTQPIAGHLAAFGTVAGSGIGFTKSFTEHATLLGLVMARADLTYSQGIQRFWFRSTRNDHYWPAFAHLGEQAILNREIYARNDANDLQVFGYQERYAEYRFFPSMVTGQFRPGAPGGDLDPWHLSQEFTALPALNSTFIQEDPPVDRVIAVTSEPHFIFDSWMDIQAARPMPTRSVPGLIDHF